MSTLDTFCNPHGNSFSFWRRIRLQRLTKIILKLHSIKHNAASLRASISKTKNCQYVNSHIDLVCKLMKLKILKITAHHHKLFSVPEGQTRMPLT